LYFAQAAFKLRGEKVERSFAHSLGRGGSLRLARGQYVLVYRNPFASGRSRVTRGGPADRDGGPAQVRQCKEAEWAVFRLRLESAHRRGSELPYDSIAPAGCRVANLDLQAAPGERRITPVRRICELLHTRSRQELLRLL